MKLAAAAAVSALFIAGPALAQTTPPAAATPPSPAVGTTDSQTAPARDQAARSGRGAHIKVEAPGGAEISVRCADGETTRACADVVVQLLERTRSVKDGQRQDLDGDRDRRDDRRDNEWRRDRY